MKKSILLLTLLVAPAIISKPIDHKEKTPIKIDYDEIKEYQSMDESLYKKELAQGKIDDALEEEQRCCSMLSLAIVGITEIAKLVVFIVGLVK